MSTSQTDTSHRGPWYHRSLVWTFGTLLGLLVFWLLGFIVSDLGTWPGPQYNDVEAKLLDPALVSANEDLDQQWQQVMDDIEAKQERQTDLRDSTDSAAETMNRLLDIQRLALEKNKDLSERDKQSLADAKDLFLSNQKKYQQSNQDIAKLKQQRRDLDERREDLKARLDQQREKARDEYEQRRSWHEIKMAGIKLAVLVPLLILSVLAFLRWRGGLYAPLVYAFGIATALRVGMVMHQHFPTRYFKYMLILVAIAIVVVLLVRLLKHMAQPAEDWLLKQYREAYERFLCPVCEYPIRRGPLRFHYWNRRTIKSLNASLNGPSTTDLERYVCPSCATTLHDICDECNHLRPTLMRACPHCGKERPSSDILAEVSQGGD